MVRWREPDGLGGSLIDQFDSIKSCSKGLQKFGLVTLWLDMMCRVITRKPARIEHSFCATFCTIRFIHAFYPIHVALSFIRQENQTSEKVNNLTS